MNSKQKKIALAVAGGIALLAIVASCSRRSPDYAYAPQPQVVAAAPQYAAPAAAPAAAPVIVNQAPSNDGFLNGLLMGHLMSGGFGGNSRVEHHYVNTPTPATRNVTKNVTINKTYVQPAAPVVAARPNYSAPVTPSKSYSAPSYSAPSKSYSSGYGSYSSRSSSSSFSSRSYSGGYGRR